MINDQTYTYQVGGSLPADANSYVSRQADQDFLNGLLTGELCYVLNARQMGKSSLRVQVMQNLKAADIHCVAIDMTALGTTQVSPEEWYFGILDVIVSRLDLGNSFDLDNWWEEHHLLSPVRRFGKFLEAVLLTSLPQKIVILLDEIDSTLSLGFSVDDFFAVIRESYNKRADCPAYQRLTFALIGVASPSWLIQDKQRTPFNVGRAIELSGLQRQDVYPLSLGLAAKTANPQAVLDAILDWTNGQPFLTQKICQLVLNQAESIVTGQEVDDVTRLIQGRIIDHWEAQDDPEHLKTIRDRLLSNQQQSGRLLGLYQQLLEQVSIPAEDTAEQVELRLTGLAIKQNGQLNIANRIYQTVFNASWVAQALAQLRPYGGLLEAWIASEQTDESRLLRGQALEESLQWSASKKLSEVDYQYLAQSQDAERKAIQLTLTAEQKARELERREADLNLEALAAQKKANHLLAKASQKAQQRILLGSIVLGITLIAAVITGGFALKAIETLTDIQKISKLEQDGVAALRTFESQQIDALVEAIATGRSLQTLDVQDRPSQQNRYSAVSPVYALRTILKNIRERSRLKGHQDVVKTATFSPNGDRILTTSRDMTARLWSLQGETLVQLKQPLASIEQAQFRPDGQAILTVSTKGTAQMWTLEGQPLITLDGHEEPITSAGFSPDGQRIVTGSADRSARIWTWQAQQTSASLPPSIKLQGHQDQINAVNFSPDGQLVVTASDDRTARIWTQEGVQVALLEGHQAEVQEAQFSPNGQLIVTTSADQTARIWTLEGRSLGVLSGHGSPVTNAHFSPDSRQVVTTSLDSMPRVWHLNDELSAPAPITLEGHRGRVYTARFSPDGDRIVTASTDRTARVWNLQGQELFQLPGHLGWVYGAQFSPDGDHIVTASADGTGRVWQLTGNRLARLQGHLDLSISAQFSPDGEQIVTGALDNSARLWDSQGNLIAELNGHPGLVRAAQFSPDGQAIATLSGDKTVRIWDRQGVPLTKLKGHQNLVLSANFSPDSTRIVTASLDKTIRIWDRQGQQLAQLLGHQEAITSARFSPDSRMIVTTSADRTARIWNVEGQQLAQLDGHQELITNASFHPNGQQLITTSFDRTARLWDLQGNILATLRGHQGWVTDAIFSPDGERIVTASADKTARIWDREGNLIATLQGHQDKITGVFFSPDGRQIITTGADRLAQLWTGEGKLLAKLQGHQHEVSSADFNPDGTQIVTAGLDNTIRVWDLQGRQLAQFQDALLSEVGGDLESDRLSAQVGERRTDIWSEQTLDQLLVRGCNWLRGYLTFSPDVKPATRQLCGK